MRCHRRRQSSFRRRSPAGSRLATPMRAPEFWHEPPGLAAGLLAPIGTAWDLAARLRRAVARPYRAPVPVLCVRSEEHTSELQSRFDLVCRLLLEKKKIIVLVNIHVAATGVAVTVGH